MFHKHKTNIIFGIIKGVKGINNILWLLYKEQQFNTNFFYHFCAALYDQNQRILLHLKFLQNLLKSHNLINLSSTQIYIESIIQRSLYSLHEWTYDICSYRLNILYSRELTAWFKWKTNMKSKTVRNFRSSSLFKLVLCLVSVFVDSNVNDKWFVDETHDWRSKLSAYISWPLNMDQKRKIIRRRQIG